MRASTILSAMLTATVASAASSAQLFVSDYAGSVSSLSLAEQDGGFKLTKTATNNKCAPNPSWLTLDCNKGELFCLNEGLNTVNGSLSSFTVNQDGSLQSVQNAVTINGPVSGAVYGDSSGQRGIVLAHYGGSAVTTYLLLGSGKFKLNQKFTFRLTSPTADPSRQDAPHEHQALLDPTGKYILVPDLAADIVRVFRWEANTLALTELQSLKVAYGSGPRHAAFWISKGSSGSGSCTTYFYVVSELSAAVTSYAVQYLANDGGLAFKQVYATDTYGGRKNVTTRRNAPAEIHVSPDNRFLMISNRNDSVFDTTLSNGTKIKSDSLSTFSLKTDGSLDFVQLAPARGSYPRQFSINAAGDLVAVGLQLTMAVDILRRNVTTGLIGDSVARLDFGGQVTSVIWNQQGAVQ